MNWEERSKSQTPHELSGNGHDGRSETTDGGVVARMRIRADELQAGFQKENGRVNLNIRFSIPLATEVIPYKHSVLPDAPLPITCVGSVDGTRAPSTA